MITVAFPKDRDAEHQGADEYGGIFVGKKRLLVIVGSAALAIVMIVGVVLSRVLQKVEPPPPEPKSVQPESSHTVIIQPALTMTYVMHFVKTHWPIVAAVSAVLVIAVVMALVFLLSRKPEIPEPIDEPVVVEEEPNFFTTPLGIASLLAAAVAIVLFLYGIWKVVGSKPNPPDIITASTTIDELFPIWGNAGNSMETAARQLIILSVLARKMNLVVDKATHQSIVKMADTKKPTFPWGSNKRIIDDVNVTDDAKYETLDQIMFWSHSDLQKDTIPLLASKMMAALVAVDESRRPIKPDFQVANDKLTQLGLGAFNLVAVGNLAQGKEITKKFNKMYTDLENFNY